MGLFDTFRKKPKMPIHTDIVAPVSGELISAEAISDDVFAKELMGQTIGIAPSDGTIVVPVDGEVVALFPTGHAFGIQGRDGNGYLVHIGIDTVSMNGEGFELFIQQGQHVKAGQKAVTMDLELIKQKGLDPTVMLIVTETAEENFKVTYIANGSVEKGQKINQ